MKRRTIITFWVTSTVILSWILPYLSLAQDYTQIEKLKKGINLQNDKDQIVSLNRIAFAFRNSYPDSTIYYATKSIELSRKYNREGEIAEAENFIGLAYSYKGKRNEALKHFQVALEVASSSNDSTQLAYSFNNMGRLLLENANLEKAYDQFVHAQTIFTRLKNQEGLSYVYRSLSDLFQTQHDYEDALSMAKKALEVRKIIGDQRGMISAHEQIGKIYQLTQDYASAENELREAEEIASNLEDEASLAEIKLGLGELYFTNGSFTKAMTEAFRANSMIQKLKSPLLGSRSDLLLGKLFLKEKNYKEARSYLNTAVTESKAMGQLQTLTEANFYLAKWYSLQGFFNEANQYELTYRALNDSLKNQELELLAQKFNFQIEIEKGNRENELLKAKESENLAIIKFQRLLNFGSILLIALFSVFSYLIWRSARARKRINKELALKNERLNELNHEKDSLMGMVAHDLKTPLANIHSMTEMVNELGELNPQQNKFVSLIKSSSQSGLSLIGELLYVHSLESELRPELKPVDLFALIHSRNEAFDSAAKAKSIQLTAEPVVATQVLAEPDWLTRCLDNLISNAIKFSKKGSQVILSSGVNGDIVWISIKDNGPGFTEEDKKNLFQKFKRLSARPTGEESSNGLGLSIVKTLIERMQGTITLLSEKGKGSEFIIQLPVYPAAQ